MTTLLLIRHATTASTGKRLGGRTQASLDEAGRAQAQACAERLADLPLRALYSSPLPRTVETAEIVAAPHRLQVRPLDGLLEVDYGDWTDRPLAQVARTKRWPIIQNRPSLVTFPNGERIRDAQLRAVAATEDLISQHRRGVVGVVSHADVIKAVVAFYLGQPLDLFQRLHIAPASVSALELSAGGRPTLLRLGDDGPLTRDRFVRAAPRGRASRRG
ncbi:histidine phosphatase family protein [soil metagenome]|jgi:probable phosphoglycerate mutase